MGVAAQRDVRAPKSGSSLSPTERRLAFMSNSPGTRGLADATHPKPIEILVVQSNPADTMMTMEAFRAAGVTDGLQCVTDGEDALSYLHREGQYSDVQVPDLIFLDLSQPRVSGLEVLRLIKSTKHLLHIPIVVAAGSDDPDFVRAVYKLNGNCFIRKPSELGEFVRFIRSCHDFWGTVVTLCPQDQQMAAGIAAGRLN